MSSSTLKPKWLALVSMICWAVICRGCLAAMKSARTDSAELARERLPVQAGEGGHPDERAFELPDVVLDHRGDEIEDVVADDGVLMLGFGSQDRDSGLELGRLDVGSQAGQQPAPEAVLQGCDRPRRAIGGEDDLLRGAVEGVERVEELLLQGLLLVHELDVVDEQHVAFPVPPAEGAHVVLCPQRLDELVHEGLGRDVADPHPREVLPYVVPDRLQQMGLSESRGAVHEQGVVGARRRLGYRERRRMRESVGRPDDKGVKGVLGVEGYVVGPLGVLRTRR